MPASQLYRMICVNNTTNMNRHNARDPQRVQATTMGGPNRRTVPEQRDLDAAMWYGAATTGAWQATVRKIFQLFYEGGVMVHTNGAWADYRTLGHPVASLLSHGGRVIVQTRCFGVLQTDPVWDWLNAPTELPKRGFATHGLSSILLAKPMMGGHKQHWSEDKGFATSLLGAVTARHHAFNVPLGGLGNANPTSAATTKTGDPVNWNWSFTPVGEDGRDGHVYVYYHGPRPTHPYGGIMIGCENVEHGKGVNPHTGAGHSATGAANAITATGGKKWADWNGAAAPDRVLAALYVDLTHLGASAGDVTAWLNASPFDPDDLDRMPKPVPYLA